MAMALLSFTLHAAASSFCLGHRLMPHHATEAKTEEADGNPLWWLMEQIFDPGPTTKTTTTTTTRSKPDNAGKLRSLAQGDFDALHQLDVYEKAYWKGRLNLNRRGGQSIFEQTRRFMSHSDENDEWWDFKTLSSNRRAWYADWQWDQSINFTGEHGQDLGGLRKEWIQLNLQSVVAEEKPSQEALECLKCNKCANSSTPQMLLEPLVSGELIPILDYEQATDAELAGGQGEGEPGKAGSFYFLGQWIARAYIISGMGYSPAGFHSIIYESIWHGKTAVPHPAPNAYADEDLIRECEWIAGIYGHRRQQELHTYGWQSCDEIVDPDSGRYTDQGCYKPLWRSQEMWGDLYTEWGPHAPHGVQPHDLVPFSRAQEYTRLKCKAVWTQNFKAPVDELVKGFSSVLPHNTESQFWPELATSGGLEKLQKIVEGSSEVDLEKLLSTALWGPGWTSEQKQFFTDALYRLKGTGRGLPPMQNPLNKLLRFFTGSFKEPVIGFGTTILSEVVFLLEEPKQDVKNRQGNAILRCTPLTGHTCFNQLSIPLGCLRNPVELDRMIHESIAVEGYSLD